MRTFDSSFAAELALEQCEPFLTAVFRWGDGRAPAYVSDRDVTIAGNVHLPIIAWPDGWGELASVFDRQDLRLDVQAQALAFINYPLPSELTFPQGMSAGMRWGEMLKRRTEATEVDIYQNVRRASDGLIFQEIWFTGIIQGGPSYSYERVQCRIVSLTEKYLLGDVLRTVDPDIFKFAHQRDVNATIPFSVGNVPRGIGRVVKGRLVSTPIPAAGNDPASGELTEVEVDFQALHHYRYSLSLATNVQTITVHFLDGVNYRIDAIIGRNQTGLITEDFTTDDGVFTIPSASWQGVFLAGDEFTFQIDATRSEVEFGDLPSFGVGQFQSIGTIYCNDVALVDDDVKIEVQEGNSINLGIGDGTFASTMVRLDGYSGGIGGAYPLIGLNSAGGSAPSNATYALVLPFTAPGMLSGGKLLKVGLRLARDGLPPPIFVGVLDQFNPYGIGAYPGWLKSMVGWQADEYTQPPQDPDFTGGNPDGFGDSAPSRGAGEAFLGRTQPYSPRDFPDGATITFGGNGVAWFTVNQEIVPGRKYYLVVRCEDGLSPNATETRADAWRVATISGLSTKFTYINPTAPGVGYRFRASDYFGPLYILDAIGSFDFSIVPDFGLWTDWVYAGGLIQQLDNGAPSAAAGSSAYLQQLKLNRGIIATKLGVSFFGDPNATGSAVVNIRAAESTGQSREIIGSTRVEAADVRAVEAGKYHFIDKFLPRPTLLRTGFYNIEVIPEVDPVTKTSTLTVQGGTSTTLIKTGSGSTVGSSLGLSKWHGQLAPSSPLQTINGGDPISLGIKITAARMTREIGAIDDAGSSVARVTFDTWLPDDFIITADLRALQRAGSTSPEKIFQMALEADHVQGPKVPTARIDVAGSFAAAATALAALGFSFDGQVIDQQSWKQLFLRWAFECRCVFDWSVDKVRLKFTPSEPGTPVFSIDYDDTFARGLVPEVTVTRSDVGKLINSIDVLYSRKYQHTGQDDWAGKLHGEDAVSVGIDGRREKPDLFKLSMVRSKPMAQNLLDFYLFRFKARDSIEVQTPLITAAVEKDDQLELTNL